MIQRASILGAALVFVTGVSHAADVQFAGYGDVRLVAPPASDAYLDGGLGKLRFGADDPDPGVKLGDLVGELRVGDMGAWSVQADARLNADYGPALDLLEGFVRYAPASNTRWQWSARAGAFFAPLSLENEEIGWSSFWTVTPSAIDSWIGSELRTVGAEGTLDWHSNGNDVTLIGALFGFNDTAGVMIAERGWNFDDRATGLFETSRLPDAVAVAAGRVPPLTTHLFREIDDSPGWYLDASYQIDRTTGFEVMRYDNEADPTRPRAWHTAFWDLGLRRQIGAVTLLSQALSGTTLIRPSATAFTATDFKSAYVLVGWDLDDWWLAARADLFQTRTRTAALGPSPLSEDGHAFDATASWRLRSWLRLSAEYLLSDDRRAQRVLDGDAPQQSENQFQLVLRTYF
ncbi:MAG TPA: hypothetical protein VNU97_05120 [Rhizomicrobium sp.]|jgi:hypothetical protein|nr:hypothetical protein [Rhizomicrobium sp.]